MTEGRLVTKIVKAVRTRYPKAWVFKVVGNPYQMTGVPDLLFVVDGLLVGAEVKKPRPGERPDTARSRATPGQRVQIKRINAAGGIAAVVLSEQETLELIQRGLERKWSGS